MGKDKMRPALAAFLLMLTMSLLSTALSFFVSPVCADLAWRFGYRVLGICWAPLCPWWSASSSAAGTTPVVISCSSVASFAATPGWGMVYDAFGTYTPALVAMPVLLALAVAALTMAFRKGK